MRMKDLAQLALFGSAPCTVRRGAGLSLCRTYRFRLWRTWDDDNPPAVFCGLNPSTADEFEDDPTIRRCLRFAKDWGTGGLVMVNLFAFRSTDPEGLRRRELLEELTELEQNVEHLKRAVEHAAVCVAAWGAYPLAKQRAIEIYLRGVRPSWQCLGTTKDGHPRHPLYVRADTPLKPYQI